MSQYVKQGNIFGRIGSGIGRGLAEQGTKEIERSRLQSGLQDVANNSEGLTPFQRFAKLSGVPGITPQAIQSGSELLRQEGIRNSFRPYGNGAPSQPNVMTRQGSQPQEMPGSSQGNIQRSVVQGDQIPGAQATRGAQAALQEGIVKENPTKNKFIPAVPWTPAERDTDLGREADRHPELTYDQLQQRVSDNERRYLEAPEAYQKQYNYLKDREYKAEEELDSQLKTSLQKEGNEIYKDLTGETLLDIKKAMRHDLATDPNLTEKQAAEKWRRIGKDFVDSKGQVKALANRDLSDRIAPGKKESALKALKETQKTYAKLGKQKEFYNMLRSNNTPEGGYGFGLSPGAAALIAYPRSESVKKIVNSIKHADLYDPRKIDANTRKIADDFANNRTNGDSIGAFVREMSLKFPQFNSNIFIDYLRDNRDEFNFNPEQKLELEMPYEDFFPNWGDLALFPLSGRSAVND